MVRRRIRVCAGRRGRRRRDGVAVCRSPRLRSARREPCWPFIAGSEVFPANSSAGRRHSRGPGVATPICRSTTSRNISSPTGFRRKQASPALADYIRRKYRGRRIDLVIAMTNPALQFVLDHRDELFPDAPIVFRGRRRAGRDVRSAGGGITGVIRVGSAYAETLKLALELHPSTERVFVVARSPNQQDVDSVTSPAPRLFATGPAHVYRRGDAAAACWRPSRPSRPEASILHIWQRRETPGKTARSAEKSRDSWPRPRRCLFTGPSTLHRHRYRRRRGARHARDRRSRRAEMALADSRRHTRSGHSDRRRAGSCRSSIGAR